MDNTNVIMTTIPLDYVCIKRTDYEAMLISIAKNQELFDNLVAYLQGERTYIDAAPIKRLLGMEELPEED